MRGSAWRIRKCKTPPRSNIYRGGVLCSVRERTTRELLRPTNRANWQSRVQVQRSARPRKKTAQSHLRAWAYLGSECDFLDNRWLWPRTGAAICGLMSDRPIPTANSCRMRPSRPRASPRNRASACALCGGGRWWRLRWPQRQDGDAEGEASSRRAHVPASASKKSPGFLSGRGLSWTE
jgi:hypothetical protein